MELQSDSPDLLHQDGESILEDIVVRERKTFKRQNFILLNIFQCFILTKRGFYLHLTYLFSTILRFLFPALIVLFVYLFRLAIISQTDSNSHALIDYGQSFDLNSAFGEDASKLLFLYSDSKCTAAPCVSGEIKNSILHKLGLKESQVTVFEKDELNYYLSNTSKFFMGGVALVSLYPNAEHFAIDYTIITNGTEFRSSPFSFIPDVSVSDYSMQIQKAVLDTLSEYTLKYYPRNSTAVQARQPNTDLKPNQMKRDLNTADQPINSEQNEDVMADTAFHVKPFPIVLTLSYGSDTMYHNLMPPVIVLALFMIAIQAHFSLNQERQSKSRIAMKMMGLRQTPYWCSLLFVHSIFIFGASLFAVIAGFILQINFISRTNPFIIFSLFFLFGMSMISNFFLCSTCCGNSRSTNVNALILLMINLGINIAYNPIFAIGRDSKTNSVVTVGIYLSTFPGMAWLNLIPAYHFFKLSLDISGQTMDVKNLSTDQFEAGPGFGIASLFMDLYPDLNDSVPKSYWNLIFLCLLIIVYFLMTFYFDNIIPHISGGTKLPFYYPFLPSYWGLMRRGASNLGIDVAVHRQDKFSSVLVDVDEDIYEEYQNVVGKLESDTGEIQEMPIKVVKLSKAYTSLQGVFSGGNKTALDSLTFSCNRNEITVLLGHNGGGKSTTLNILTGVITPTSGDALFGGLSAIHNMDYIRKDLGVCMQDDIIFEGMSGYQMMQLFAFLKGIQLSRISEEIKEKLNLVSLWKYRNQKSSTYSGGMKRRLSLAIACLGDPKYIILDEICSGVDPAARRMIWNILGKLKQDRSILLSTHDLYEAEMIADKIVILALGRCRGLGTLHHLKNRYGSGFSVQAVTDKPEELKEKVQMILPGSEVESEAHGSINFSLPQIISPQLLNFFSFLEEQTKLAKSVHEASSRANILLKDFELSQTTLEQIFLRLTHGGKHGVRNLQRNQQDLSTFNQLNIALENADDCLGYVEISSPTMTIEALRHTIATEIENAPKEFEFLSNGVPLSRNQEKTKFALQFAPLIVIRPIQSTHTSSDHYNLSLHEQNNQLRMEIIELKKKIDYLMKKLEEKEGTVSFSEFLEDVEL